MSRVLLLSFLLAPALAAAEPPPLSPKLETAAPRVRKLQPIQLPPASNAVPNGSYLASCGPVSVSGDVLTATCRSGGSGDIVSDISVSRCAGVDISNYHCRLRCLTPVRANWGGRVLRNGSWAASCEGGIVNGSTMKAFCRTGEGEVKMLGLEMSREGIRETTLDLAGCPDGADVANIRGYLTCVR